MKAIKHSWVPGSLAVLLLLSGCVKLWQESLDIKTYLIEARREGGSAQTALAPKLWIDSVTVLPPYNMRGLVLRKSDVEFTASYYTELLMSPSENIRNELYMWLSTSGLFEDVSIVNRAGKSHSLHVTVMEFYGDATSQEAVLTVKATLIDDRTKEVGVVFSNDYRRRIAVSDNSADELIRAYNVALGGILSDLERDMGEAVGHYSGSAD